MGLGVGRYFHGIHESERKKKVSIRFPTSIESKQGKRNMTNNKNNKNLRTAMVVANSGIKTKNKNKRERGY